MWGAERQMGKKLRVPASSVVQSDAAAAQIQQHTSASTKLPTKAASRSLLSVPVLCGVAAGNHRGAAVGQCGPTKPAAGHVCASTHFTGIFIAGYFTIISRSFVKWSGWYGVHTIIIA